MLLFLKSYVFDKISESYLSQTKLSKTNPLELSKPLLGDHSQVVRISNKSRDLSLFFLSFPIKKEDNRDTKLIAILSRPYGFILAALKEKNVHVWPSSLRDYRQYEIYFLPTSRQDKPVLSAQDRNNLLIYCIVVLRIQHMWLFGQKKFKQRIYRAWYSEVFLDNKRIQGEYIYGIHRIRGPHMMGDYMIRQHEVYTWSPSKAIQVN